MKKVNLVRLVLRVVEVIGVGVEAEVEVGQDHIREHQDLEQDQDHLQEVHTEAGIGVMVATCVAKDGHQGAGVDLSVRESKITDI